MRSILSSVLFSLSCCVFSLFLLATDCQNKTNNNQTQETSQPNTSTPPSGYEKPTIPKPIPIENLDKDCYEAVNNTESIPCPDVYAPVCGCDNKNYSNACQAKREGIKKWTEGNCK